MIYFLAVIGFTVFFMHPVFLLISFVGGLLYSVLLKGKQAGRNLVYILPMILLMALMNPLFNHRGVNILLYLPSGNPLTMESIIYGGVAALMIAGVICHFICYNEVMSSDKFIYLFGKIIPSLSLVFSMTLRFVPRFIRQFKIVYQMQKLLKGEGRKERLSHRFQAGVSTLSAMLSWSLENALDTADSMKARGYGLPGRTAFSLYRMDGRDVRALASILALSVYVLYAGLSCKMSFQFFPTIVWPELTLYSLTVYVAFMVLCTLPLLIEFWEVRRWQSMKSKI
ncbi:MAG: energy-coupling factor transporter transmembrane protein EcfT [Clostridia bacterium]|nr:energy-coupling factor transporter transmembrane protein EcfT [Clostridia bacterium]